MVIFGKSILGSIIVGCASSANAGWTNGLVVTMALEIIPADTMDLSTNSLRCWTRFDVDFDVDAVMSSSFPGHDAASAETRRVIVG